MIQSTRWNHTISYITNNPWNILLPKDPTVRKYLWVKWYYKSPNWLTYSVFENEQKWKEAIWRLLSLPNYKDLTVGQALARWVWHNNNIHQRLVRDNMPYVYNVKIGDLSNRQMSQLANLMQRWEGWK